jgi:hypothetical protein
MVLLMAIAAAVSKVLDRLPLKLCLFQVLAVQRDGRGLLPSSSSQLTQYQFDRIDTVFSAELFGPGHFVGLGLRLKSEIRTRTRT